MGETGRETVGVEGGGVGEGGGEAEGEFWCDGWEGGDKPKGKWCA